MADKGGSKQRKACWDDEVRGFVKSVTEYCSVDKFTDGGSTSGYMDFPTNSLPANCIVLGWRAVTTAAGKWDKDTTAVMTVGVAGTTDKYSGGGAASVAIAGTVVDVGKLATNAPLVYNAAAATPRVTVKGNSDFTAFVTAGTCASTVTIYYIELG